MSALPILWHYTCDHHVEAIKAEGVARPMLDEFVWFTDLAEPVRDALGLTMHTLTCDRTRHRFRVVGSASVLPYVTIRRTLPRGWREGLEESEGAMPRHWYVSREAVPVIYSPGRGPRP